MYLHIFLLPHALESLNWIMSILRSDICPTPMVSHCMQNEIPGPYIGPGEPFLLGPCCFSNVIQRDVLSLSLLLLQPFWLLQCSKPTSGPLHLLFPGPRIPFLQISTWFTPSVPSGYGAKRLIGFPRPLFVKRSILFQSHLKAISSRARPAPPLPSTPSKSPGACVCLEQFFCFLFLRRTL